MDGVEIRVHGGEDDVLRAVAELGRVLEVTQVSPVRQDGRHTYNVWIKAPLRLVEDSAPVAQRETAIFEGSVIAIADHVRGSSNMSHCGHSR